MPRPCTVSAGAKSMVAPVLKRSSVIPGDDPSQVAGAPNRSEIVGDPVEMLISPSSPTPSLPLALLKVSDSGGSATIWMVVGESALATLEMICGTEGSGVFNVYLPGAGPAPMLISCAVDSIDSMVFPVVPSC